MDINITAWLVGLVVAWIIAALILLFVDRLNIGVRVGGLGSALLAALVIAMWSLATLPILRFLQAPFSAGTLTLLSWVVGWVFGACIILLAARFMKGFEVRRFSSALVTSLALGAVSVIADWVVNLF